MSIVREFKGENRLTLLDDYTIIDIETSNNGRKYGEIVEISCVKVRNNEIVATFDELIKPTKPIDPWTQSIHHISNEMVRNKPSIKEVYPKLLDFVGDDLLIGHNVHFDINFIYDYHQELNQPPLSNHFLDTLRLARRTLPKMSSYSLSNLSEHFGFEPTTHRALEDCLATHRLYQILKNRLSDDEKENLAKLKVKPSRWVPSFDLESLTPENTFFDPESKFKNKKVLFTGKISKLTRKEAAQLVVNQGGKVLNDFTPEIDILVVGKQRYPNSLSTKQKQALNYEHITILTQEQFLDLIK